MAMMVFKFVLVAVAAYFLGCCNGSILVSKFLLHDDIRQHGSGNAGLTNFYRVFGGKSTILVIIIDMGKAFAAVGIGALVINSTDTLGIPMLGKLWAAVFVMLGHDFPVMFGFKGGKGVLSGGAMTLALDWRVALLCWGAFLILFLITRYVSLGSIAAGVAFIVAMIIFYPYWQDLITGTFCALLLIWGHRGNISRLIHGTERKFSFHRDKDKEGETSE